MIVKRIAALVVAAISLTSARASAQEAYPSKPVRLIVPFTAAGATDILGRLVGQKLSEAWGQQVVIDNRPGAGGNLGAELAAKSPPDGYAILLGGVSTHGINPNIYPKMPFDPVKDFAPISMIATLPNVLVVNPTVPANSVQELVALAKQKPGTLNFASSGIGTSIHMSGELFKSMTGVQIVHVPYKGSAPAVADLLGGQVQMMFDNMPSALPHVKAGTLRALGVTTANRSANLPDVPTIAESGVPGFEATSWFGIFAPAGTPKPIVDKISADLVKVLQAPDVKARVAELGFEPLGTSPAQLAAFVDSELVKWAKVVKESGAKAE